MIIIILNSEYFKTYGIPIKKSELLSKRLSKAY